jgi:hypothetical protein
MMKRIFSTLIFTLFSLGLFAQADTIFVIGAEFGVVTVVNDSTFQVSSEHPADQLGQGFLPTQIQVGYQLFDINGRLFRVSSIVSANFGESVMQVVELQDNNIGPVGVGVVYRKPDNSDCVPIIPQGNTGLSPAIVAKIHNHNAVVGCGGTGGGGGGTVETVVSGTGISVDATDAANPIVTNTAPDQTVVLAEGANMTITGTYPSFTLSASGGGSGVTSTNILNATILSNIALYGVAPVYSTAGGVFTEASTTDNTTLHQFYVRGASGSPTILGAGTVSITATFAYTVGTTYYLTDSGTLATSADNDGDAIDYISAAVYCVANLGSNTYIVNLKDPVHFVNN